MDYVSYCFYHTEAHLFFVELKTRVKKNQTTRKVAN